MGGRQVILAYARMLSQECWGSVQVVDGQKTPAQKPRRIKAPTDKSPCGQKPRRTKASVLRVYHKCHALIA